MIMAISVIQTTTTKTQKRLQVCFKYVCFKYLSSILPAPSFAQPAPNPSNDANMPPSACHRNTHTHTQIHTCAHTHIHTHDTRTRRR
jgi:hypothetical protein